MQEIHLIRHGETEWSLSGRHTGTTDLPLTENGRRAARRLASVLERVRYSLVLTSPLERAKTTCELAGLGEQAEVDIDLREWGYGDYEGLTPAQIRTRVPDWIIFRDGCPGGEGPGEIGIRADRLVARVRATEGNVAMFAHGHFFRMFVARWLGVPVAAGAHFLLDTATLSVLGAIMTSQP